jgi:tripartite-type tricarboxylate transporter receptor subunit TctC
MKTILTFLMAMLFSMSAVAQKTVEVIWPFAPGSNQASALRKIIDHANTSQNTYRFIFGNRPGAGGAIAVNHMLNDKQLTLVMSSTSIFTRPAFYPNESYKLDDLAPIFVTSYGSPLVLVSKKYKSIEDLRAQKEVTVGVNYGSVTEIVAKVLQSSLPNTKLIMVPYPNGLNAITDTAGGHVDTALNLPRDVIQFVETGALHVVGATGTKDNPPFKTFKSQGINSLDSIAVNYYILGSNKLENSLLVELNEIFRKANATADVKELWFNDYSIPTTMNLKETEKFWTSQDNMWKTLSKNIQK